MQAGTERKYTDRDVRENPDFQMIVVDYLQKYQGEFDFLVDMKMRLGAGYDLTVGMIRGVLNCMRHDPRVTGLPEPVMTPKEGKVLQMPPRPEMSRKDTRDCDIEGFHGRHGYSNDPDWHVYWPCDGKYPINRNDFEVRAFVKVPYMMSRSGKLLHKTSGEPGSAWFMWRPIFHQWGWRYTQEGEPDLYVRTACQYPRIIDNPILVPKGKLEEALDERVGSSANQHELCKRCFQ